MNEDLIRSIVRDTIRRRLAAQAPAVAAAEPPVCVPFHEHPSHVRLTLVRGADDGPCLIEPVVPCVHCEYCRSHGH